MKKLVALLLALSMSFALVSAQAENRPFEGQTLTILFMSGSYAKAASAIEADFEAATGAQIEIVDFPYATLHEKMLLDFTSGTASYDVVDVACQWDGEMAQYLEPLDSYIQRDHFDIDDFSPNVLDNCGRWENAIYGIPNANTPFTMAYRTDIISEDELPDTWEDYLALAAKYQNPEKGLYGIAPSAAKAQYGASFYTRIWCTGEDWADQNWNVKMNTPTMKWALESTKAMLDVADPACLSWALADATAAFVNGNAIFLEAWPTLGLCLTGDDPAQSKVAGKWALAPLPSNGTNINLLSGWDVSINKNSDNKDLAWEFIKAYTSADAMLKAFKDYSILPPRLSVWENEAIKDTSMYTLKKYLDTSVIWWRIPASEEARAEISNGLAAYMAGEMSVEEAMDYMQSGVENALMNNPPAEGQLNSTAEIVAQLAGK